MPRATDLGRRKEELIEIFKSEGLPTHETRSFTGHKRNQDEPVEAQADLAADQRFMIICARRALWVLGMLKKLGEGDVQVLRALLFGMPKIQSHHRLGLELFGLVRDGADGLRLTPAGREIAEQAQSGEAENTSPTAHDSKRDALGRRKPGSHGRGNTPEEREEGG